MDVAKFLTRFSPFDQNEIVFAIRKDPWYAVEVLSKIDDNVNVLTTEMLYSLTRDNVNKQELESIEEAKLENSRLEERSFITHKPCMKCSGEKYKKLERNEHLGADEIGSSYLICINCNNKIRI